MWQLKIKAREKWNLFNSRAVKFGVTVYFYSQNYYEEKGKLYFIGSGIVEGNEKQRSKFFRDLKKDSKIKHLETKNEFFTSIYGESKTANRVNALKVVYNPRLIHLKPVIIDSDGWEEWEIASTNKKDLDATIDQAEKLENVESKVFYLKEDKIDNIMIYSMLPKLTDRQKEVLLLAVKEGYYGYPRSVKLDELARKIKLSVSTYQFHLAKAEAKLIPFVSRNL